MNDPLQQPASPPGSVENTSIQRPFKMGWIFLGITIGILLFTGAVVFSVLHKGERVPYRVAEGEPVVQQEAAPPQEEDNNPADYFEIGKDAFGSFVRKAPGELKEYRGVVAEGELVVDWHMRATPIGKEEVGAWMATVDSNYRSLLEKECGFEQCDVFIYEAGTVQAPKKMEGKKVYDLFVPTPGLGIFYYNHIVLYDEALARFVLLEQEEPSYVANYTDWFLGKVRYPFKEFTFPRAIDIPNSDSNLFFRRSYADGTQSPFSGVYAENNRGGILNVIEGTFAKVENSPIVFTDPVYGSVYMSGSLYNIVLPDGAVQQYDLKPYFFVESTEGQEKDMYSLGNSVDIVWNKEVNIPLSELYDLSGDIGPAGCGQGFLIGTNIVDNTPWFDEKNLVEIGRTKKGEAVFELLDKQTNEYYKALFDYGYAGAQIHGLGGYSEQAYASLEAVPEEEKYAAFIADHPLFFWKDHAGHWRGYKKIKYQTLAECGKPVIYLYPQKEMDVRVQVTPNGGFTKTDPLYPNNGWFVRAHPNGSLYSYDVEKVYPYLFWEGKAYGFTTPKSGFVLKREDVPSQMRALLKQAGLEEKETEDFMDFWQEKLLVKPYVFVTFISQHLFERAAPLHIQPQPNTTIRVFMDYEPLDEPKVVAPLFIRTPERKGFTVVEWGGALH